MDAAAHDCANDPRELLRDLVDEPVHLRAAPIDTRETFRFESERMAVARAIASRRREFATGRRLAHALLDALDAPAGPLLPDAERVPRWPEGVVGSISHTRNVCLVALARSDAVEAIGIDVEMNQPVERDIARIVCTPSEHRLLAAFDDPDERARRLRMIFSVKECVYKAHFPRLRERWAFQQVEVEMDATAGGYSARVPSSAGAGPVVGRLLQRGQWIASSCVLR